MIDVIAVFDIGKTNKKILLFDRNLKLVFQQEQGLAEVVDDDGFACDDIDKIEIWMRESILDLSSKNEFNIKAVNFATYGASITYLDKDGKRLTPVYNYLKSMPASVLDGFYESYGGVEEFSRKTASPASGMLNSGLQILWLRKVKPAVFAEVKDFVLFPQYLSYCFTGKVTADFTYVGCHTSLWDFDKMGYHSWLADYGIKLPDPVQSSTTFPVQINGKTIQIGIGAHDSSASLVPYLSVCTKPFVLLSTGTWCIFMNPFNNEPLTADQLRNDALCYLTINQKPVKSSRLFMGHIHQVNAKNIADHFGSGDHFFKNVQLDEKLLLTFINNEKVFFKEGLTPDYVDRTVDLSGFESAQVAYHQMMVDLMRIVMDSLSLVLAKHDTTDTIFISGGFARSEIFVKLIATLLPDKKVYTSEIDNATALGAALTVYENAFGEKAPLADLGLKEILPVKI